MRLSEIAELFGGTVYGDGDIEIRGVKGIEDAEEGDITFLASSKYLPKLLESKASAVIVKEKIDKIEKAQLVVSNPQLIFARLLGIFYLKPHPYLGISDRAYVSHKAQIHKDVTIYPFSFIDDNVSIGEGTVVFPFVYIGKDCRIGRDCIIYPHVTIRERVTVGDRVIIHSGAVVGSDGFGYVFDAGRHEKIPQVGSVIIEDDVEIGANTTIDRATTGVTKIGKGTKIDNLVQIAHNVRVGKGCIIVAQVGVAGSSVIGDGCILAGQAGISDHVEIEAGTVITAQTGVMPGKVSKGVYSGYPSMPHRDWLKAVSLFQRLPELSRRLKELEERVSKLEGQND